MSGKVILPQLAVPMSSLTTPSSGKFLIAVDNDGILKKMDSLGTIVDLEGTGAASTLAATLTAGRDADFVGVLNDNGSNPSVALNSRVLQRGNSTISIDWQSNMLKDNAELNSVDYQNRILWHTSGHGSMNWTNRVLIDPVGNANLDWANNNLIGDWTAVTQNPGDNSTKLATTAFVTSAVGAISGGTTISGLTQNYIPKANATGDNIVNSQIFDNGTNVGINTNSPTAKLSVSGTFNSGDKIFNVNNTSFTGINTYFDFLGNFYIQGGDSSYSLMNVYHADDARLNLDSGATASFTLKKSNADRYTLQSTNVNDVREYVFVPQITFLNSYQRIMNSNGSAEVVYFDATNQRVGIGTSAPNYKLEVVGSNNSTIQLVGDLTTNIATAIIASRALFGTTSNHDLGFITNGSERLTISNTGNIGIGTTSPLTKLHVDGGTGSNTQIYLKATGVDNGIQIDSGAYPFFMMKSSGITDITMQGGGGVIYFRPNINVEWRAGDTNSSMFGSSNMNIAANSYSYYNHRLGIGTSTPNGSVKLHIKGSGTTSATYGLKVENNSSSVFLEVRDDGYIRSYTDHGNGVSTIQFANSNTGTGFDYKGYYGRLALGVTNTTVNATLSLTDYGTVQNFINFDADGAKGYIHGLGGGLTFRGNHNGSLRFVISSDDGFLGNNGYRNWFKGRVVIADGGGYTTSMHLDINGVNGYDQLAMRTSYTPTGTADTNGVQGTIAWDADYVYVKTAAGWKRATLNTF